MSLTEYWQSLTICDEGYKFYALIMAAMRDADTDNLGALRRLFPEVYDELAQRRANPGGLSNAELAKVTR
jgi:hypothetical protein